jgi:nucleotide-binding universal stress UspA family protein
MGIKLASNGCKLGESLSCTSKKRLAFRNSRKALVPLPRQSYGMKKLLVAYDGSPCSDAVLADLSRAGLPAELDVTVVTVADVWLPPDPEAAEPAFPDPISKAARKARARAVEEVESSRALAEHACAHLRSLFPKWKLRARAFADSPAWGIVKEAAACKADLVVLGSHGRTALKRLFLGSVAQKVAAEARCPVRIARPTKHSPAGRQRILIAVDGSSDSQMAVHAAALRYWPEAAEFWIVTVADPKLQTAVAWPSVFAAQWVQANDKGAGEWIGRMLEHFAQELREASLKVQTDIFDGDPKEVLLREAKDWDADGIFLGARGLHHGDRLFLGSLASAVAARAHCSVEIVRPR